MIRNFSLAVIFASIALPALAGPRCDRPAAPQFDAAAGTRPQQLAALRGDVQNFLAASDVYQACLLKIGQEVTLRRIEINQREKVRIGTRFNYMVGSYREELARNSASGKLVSR